MDKSLITFHGFTVVLDEDCENLRDAYILDTNSSSQIIYCYYDENGNNNNETILANFYAILPVKPEELKYSQVLNVIKQFLKSDNFFISESAVNYIKNYSR